ncbi:MAG TPA: DUF58 domain-containing protein [Microbacterium sp.]|uniref:DUF58 domain-containing protein n=1 Tax=Microbacterium sp. TaxID=51671 RepID=UPI002B49DE37|nr:DUF58 domain-containing protein [Microbacterium sp.]HKT57671.1 DUF58 domain-containing protein [Microbacterium sp.]
MSRWWPLTLRGTGMLVLGLCCFIAAGVVGLDALLWFGVLLVALPVVCAAYVLPARRAEHVARSLEPEVARVGMPVRVTVYATVRTTLPTAAGMWLDTLPPGITGRPTGPLRGLGSGLRGAAQTLTLPYEVTASERGIRYIGPLVFDVVDPYGMARRRATAGDPTRIVVAPAIVDLGPVAGAALDVGGIQHASASRLGQGSDNLTPRRYVPGDSMRRIHWRATAHRDTLMVRQEEQDATPEATVVIDRAADRWAPAAARPGADEDFERAVTATMSAVARLVRDGYAVDVIDDDGVPLCDQLAGFDGPAVDRLLAQTATLTSRARASTRPHPFDGATEALGGALTGPVIVVAGRLDEAAVASLAHLPAHTELPALLAVAAVPEALQAAAEAGWRAIDIGSDRDLQTAWNDAVAIREMRDVRR